VVVVVVVVVDFDGDGDGDGDGDVEVDATVDESTKQLRRGPADTLDMLSFHVSMSINGPSNSSPSSMTWSMSYHEATPIVRTS
jgi:hypothetical protein